MERTLIKDTINKVGEIVRLKGWVNNKRDHGKITFVDLRDRSAIIQVVGTNLSDLKPENVVEIEGLVKARPEKLANEKLITGKIELECQKVTLISAGQELPFDTTKEDLILDLPTLLDYRSLSFRHPKVQAIFKVQAVIIDAFRQALIKKDFLEFQAPSIISAVPEGGAEVFKVKYFDYDAYLSQSPQLYKSLLAAAFERVFSVNQIFRAEPSVTTRHITEATSLDAEFVMFDDWMEIQDMEEYVVRYIFDEVAKKCEPELKLFNTTVPLMTDKIPMIKLRDAQQIIFERTGRDCRQEKDLAPEDERELCKWSKEAHGSDLVFVSHFLTKKKPFYVHPDPENPEFARSVDLLCRGVEWSSGGQRLNNYDQILKNVKEWELKEGDIELYLQSFRYGSAPIGGFALGAERMTMYILGLSNIREAAMFPRDMERIDTKLSVSKQDTVFQKIKKLLDENNVKYQEYEHEAVFTSVESAKARGTTLKQGAKALVVYGDGKPMMFVLPADRKLDIDTVKKIAKVAELRMATKDEVFKLTNTKAGAVPPFGGLFDLPLFVDKFLSENEEIAFNAGDNTRSIKMGYKDYEKIVDPILDLFSTDATV